MPTHSVILDTTQYVQVNVGRYDLMLQAHRDAVRIVLSDAQPTRNNPIFHILTANAPPLFLPTGDNNVWALATSSDCSLVATEWVDEDVWVSVENDLTDIAAIDTGINPDLYLNLFSIRNTSTTVRCEVAVVNFVVDGNKSVEFVSQIGSTLSGNTTFALLPGSTFLEVSYDGTSTGAVAGSRTILLKTSDRRTDVRGTKIYIQPGQTYTLGVRGVNGVAFIGDVQSSFRIIEEL